MYQQIQSANRDLEILARQTSDELEIPLSTSTVARALGSTHLKSYGPGIGISIEYKRSADPSNKIAE
jgi:hypothetical protein